MSAVLRGLDLQQGVLRLGRRAESVPAPEREPVPVRPPEPEAGAQVLLQQARTRLADEQRHWREHADEELAVLRDKVEREAREAGHAQALAEVRARHARELERLDAVLERLGGVLERELAKVQDLVVAIAYESAVKILGRALATPDGVRAVVVQAIAQVRQQETLVVRVPPEDYELLIDALPAEHPLARPGIEIRPDPQLAGGGCVVDTDRGQLDARLATQLGVLRDVLLEARRQSPGEGG